MDKSSLATREKFDRRMLSRVVKILLIEDCKSDVFFIEQMLENASVNCFYEITDVPRLVDAFHKIEKEVFDMVILDLNLLDIDGITSIAALHAEEPNLPIIVYTGMDDIRMRGKALMYGAKNYLIKSKEDGFCLKQMIEDIALKL